MEKITEIKPIRHNDLGDKLALEVTPYYLNVIIGRKTYHFEKEVGKFDGTSYRIAN